MRFLMAMDWQAKIPDLVYIFYCLGSFEGYDKVRSSTDFTDIYTQSEIRTHDPSVWTGEDSSYLRLRGHRNRPWKYEHQKIKS
jgi:hypothetical protein